jgi:hypothetical protein
MKTITFSNRYLKKGYETILWAGTVVYTADPHIFHVPESTLELLKEKNIPFKVLDDWHDRQPIYAQGVG